MQSKKFSPSQTSSIPQNLPLVLPNHQEEQQNDVEVRLACTDDAAETFKVITQVQVESPYMLLKPGEGVINELAQRGVLEDMQRTKKGAIFLATINGYTAGYLGIRKLGAHRCAHVASFAIGVVTAHQGMGVGFRLLQAGEAWAQQRGTRRLEMTVVEHNAAALKLYKRCDYTLEGRRRASFMLAGQPCDELYMAKIFV